VFGVAEMKEALEQDLESLSPQKDDEDVPDEELRAFRDRGSPNARPASSTK